MRSAGGRVELLELPSPQAPGPGEVVLAVQAAGMGRWDGLLHTGGGWEVGLRPPAALGVEGAGTVAAVGPDVTNVVVGDLVLTHAAPAEPAPGRACYVTDGVASCVAQAKAAAGGRDILLHGAAAAQACLRAGLLDELQLQLIPVLLGQGRRLFADLPPEHVELDLVRALDGQGVQHLRYRVVR